MILVISLLISFVLVSPSWGIMTSREFETFIEPICFRSDKMSPQYVNGQEHPLASTLENFIALAEKFEQANQQITLKEELYYFLRNFTYPNIEFSDIGDIKQWKPDANYANIDTMWEPDENLRKNHPQVEDPFTDAEKCSLYFMLSHSVVRKHREYNMHKAPPKIQGNFTDNIFKNDISFDEAMLYPQEQGIVAIKGSVEAVDFGRVLLGAYVGLNSNRKQDIDSFNIIEKNLIPTEGKMVDPLYILTLAEVIAMARWRSEANKRQILKENGYWRSIPIGSNIDTGKVCPMVYKLREGTEHAFSLASPRGAADGLILGTVSGSVATSKSNIKLSQVLRQYYSRGGFLVSTSDLGDIRASFCSRADLMTKWEPMIREQVRHFLLLASVKFNSFEDDLTETLTFYEQFKKEAFENKDKELQDYCGLPKTVDKPEDLPVETPVDVIAVLRTDATEDNFKKQQLILGSLAKRLELSYIGSRMTIFTDEKYSPSVSSPGTIYLKKVVDQTYSPACAACSVTQIAKGLSTTSIPEDELILAIHQYLTAKEENETKQYGVNGKVVILFNFEEELPVAKQNALQARLFKTLRDLHIGHKDARILALGKNIEVLKQYASDPIYAVNAFGVEEDEVGKQLFQRVASAPGKLQYSQCDTGNDEKRAVFEDYITPDSVQHWSMPAKYFYKSFNLNFMFETSQGDAKLCQSRGTPNPEFQKENCLDLLQGKPVTLKHSNPCKGFDDFSCGPFYFSILGINSTTPGTKDYCDDKLTENKCKTMDQIKFKISHEGIRCSGSMALVAPSLFLFLGLILSHLFSKFA